jgi:ribose/xylose/arabinose/galactoside ABC-type transport system permease subunit
MWLFLTKKPRREDLRGHCITENARTGLAACSHLPEHAASVGVFVGCVFHRRRDRSIICDMGRMLIYLGIVLIAAGLVIIVLGRLGLPLGRLPGDIAYRGKNVSVFAPIGTSILLSIVLSALLYLIARLWR